MRGKTGLRWLLALSGLAFIIIGLAQGAYGDTMEKAVRLCLECVGIG